MLPIAAIPDALFALLAIGVAASSYYMFERAAGSMSVYRLNIVSVTYYIWLLLMSYVGLVLNIMGVENYALNRLSEQSITMAWLTVAYVMIVMPLSMLLYQKVIFEGNVKSKLLEFYKSDIKPLQTGQDSGQKYFWVLFTTICAGSVIYCYSVVPGTPILAALAGKPVIEIARLRNITTFDFPGNVYVKNILMGVATPFVSYVAYSYYKKYDTLFTSLWFHVTIILAIFSLLYTGEIKPIVVYIVGMIVLKGIIESRLSKKLVFYSVVCGIALIGTLTYLTDGIVKIGFYSGPLSRLTMVQSLGVALSFEVFPNIHDFLYGGSFPDWMTWLFGVEHEKTGRLLMKFFNPGGVKAGTAGVVASLFVADAYANFGVTGIVISPLIIGFILQGLHSYILGLRKTPIAVALLAYCMFNLPVISSFEGMLWNVGLLFIFLSIHISLMWCRALNQSIPSR